jgi:rod shape-determining protein MreD
VTTGLITVLLAFFVGLQACLPPAYLPLDTLLLFVGFIGLYRGQGAGTACGLVSGFIMDLLAGPPGTLGLFTLSKGVAGMLADTISRSARWESAATQVLGFASISLAHDLVLALGARFAGLNQGGLGQVVFLYALPKAALHALLAVPFFIVMQRLIRRRVRRNKLAQSPRMIHSLPENLQGQGWG